MKFLNDLADERFEKELVVLVMLLTSNLVLIGALMQKCGSFSGSRSAQAGIERIRSNNMVRGIKTTTVDWSTFARAAETYKIASIYMIGSSCSSERCNTGAIAYTNADGSRGVVEETWLYGEKLIEFAHRYNIEISDEEVALFCKARQ